MITKSDLNISNQSYTKKDFYQIYPEETTLVKDLTDLWDPENTNESDPGVVLLKLLASVGDKLNYNIDKNILETSITSATQEDSVRKICEMLGYNIKYYNSATTQVVFMWTGDELVESNADITKDPVVILPRFTTVLTNNSSDISFVLTKTVELTQRYKEVTGTAIQGELVNYNLNDNSIILASNIDDNNRLYLPETEIAENGIWIFDSTESNEWEKVDNLNTVTSGKLVWKFGYDSGKKLPYIEFPSDYVNLFKEGIKVKYIRTAGASGNVKAQAISNLVNANVAIDAYTDSENNSITEIDSTDKIVVKNLYATINGCDIQTIDEIYQGFKKTVGTFDTLTTCRDYANAVYNMVNDENTDNTPLVSNCQVSDIRDELNYANTIAKYDNYGINYVNESEKGLIKVETYNDDGTPTGTTANIKSDLITDFDLYLYPLNPIKNAYNKTTYRDSFKPLNPAQSDIWFTINNNLKEYKTISHKIKQFSPSDKNASSYLYLIKNYYKLKAKIITKNKVNTVQETIIKDNIRTALWQNFNARQLEYGEEIPYDTLVSVIKNADANIKEVYLDEPTISTSYMMANGEEIDANKRLTGTTEEIAKAKKCYNRIVAKNILAGRLPLFNYNENIKDSFYETNSSDGNIYGSANGNNYITENVVANNKSITYVDTNLTIQTSEISSASERKLGKNEMVQIISPKLVTDVTYPMYVNYAYFGSNITKNSNHLLEDDEHLYIQYSDNDETTYWIKYYKSGEKYYKETWINVTAPGEVEEFSGIICPNFDLSQTTLAKAKTVETGWPDSWNSDLLNVGGLLALTTAQEIAIKSTNSAKIQQTALIYWLTNNNNTITFTSTKLHRYEYILEDGEYFFYTNSAKTDLLTLGSGTKLVYYNGQSTDPTITWSLNSEQSITSDDVAQNGIGAFANSAWIIKNFNTSEYLESQQMNITTLAEGDVIKEIELDAQHPTTYFDSTTWWTIKSIGYNNTTLTGNSVVKYQIKPILNLNLGPGLTQELKANQSLTFYSSRYLDENNNVITSNSKIVSRLDYDPSSMKEEIFTSHPIHEFTSGSSIKSNLKLEKIGGTGISLHTINLNGSIKDNILIYPVEIGNNIAPTIKKSNGSEVSGGNLLTLAASFSSGDKWISVPLYIPENNYALVTVYWESTEAGSPSVYLKDSSGNIRQENALSLYPDLSASATNKLVNLNNGKASIIAVKHLSGAEILVVDSENSTLESGVTASGLVKIVDVKLISTDGTNSDWGLNYSVFGYTNKAAANEDLFENIIKKHPDFYATLNIDNSMLLDVTDMSSPDVLFNKNNEVNKFVISELDSASFDNIQIASSSKI